jgi:hypothetical protein
MVGAVYAPAVELLLLVAAGKHDRAHGLDGADRSIDRQADARSRNADRRSGNGDDGTTAEEGRGENHAGSLGCAANKGRGTAGHPSFLEKVRADCTDEL